VRVLVIGSGLMGLVTAYFLNKAGAEVTVVDRQDSAGRETSFANGAMLHASQASPWNSPGILLTAMRMLGREDSALLIRKDALPRLLRWGFAFVRHSNPKRYASNLERNARLAQYSLSVMKELRAGEQLDYDYSSRGTMTIYRTQAALDAAATFSGHYTASGIDFDTLGSSATVATEPALRPIADQIVGSTYYPADESGDAFKFCLDLQRACQRDGVEFQFGTRVKNLLREGAVITSADTETRRLYADKFVIAAGSFTPLLTRTVGLRVPVQPVKGYSITMPIGKWDNPPLVPVIDEHFHAAVCPLGDRLRVAGTAEFAGFNNVLTESRIDNLFRLVRSVYPDFDSHLDPATTDRWTGLRPMTPSGVAIMGKTKISNLFLNTGHGHLGWTMAAGSGKAVASEVLAHAGEFELGDYELGAPTQ
jgi:D-amino-acid dehydrogenase